MWKFPRREKLMWVAWVGSPALVSIIVNLTADYWITLLRGSAEPHVLDGLRLLVPVYIIIFPLTGLVLLACVLFPRIRKNSIGWIIKTVFWGLVIQTLLIALVGVVRLLPDFFSPHESPVLSAFINLVLGQVLLYVPAVVTQVVFAGIFFGVLKIKRLSNAAALTISIIVLVGGAITGYWTLRRYSERQFIRATEERFKADEERLIREHDYREQAKEGTFLGDLAKRPYRVFRREDGTYLTIDADGREAALPSFLLPDRDLKKRLLFDVYGGRLFFIARDGSVAIYTHESGTQLLMGMKDYILTPACSTFGCDYFPNLSGAHGPYLAFDRVTSAGTSNVAVFDIRTGERVIMSAYAGYDTRRVYQFWIRGQGYRLMLDATAEPESFPVVKSSGIAQRTWQPPEKTMYFYLESFEGSPHEVPDEDFFPMFHRERALSTPEIPWADIAFSGGPSTYLAERTPFFELPSSVPGPEKPHFGDDIKYFMVRSLYKLDDTHIGLEVNDDLVVIALSEHTAFTMRDEQRIEQRLADAVPIAMDDDATDAPGYCPENDDTIKREEQDHLEFEGCVF